MAGQEDIPQATCSLQNLLSIQTMILLIDDCGGQITTWLDTDRPDPKDICSFLRWSMVAIQSLGYSKDNGGPDFYINIDSNAKKHAGQMSSRHFHIIA